jgi:hypothetical protein
MRIQTHAECPRCPLPASGEAGEDGMVVALGFPALVESKGRMAMRIPPAVDLKMAMRIRDGLMNTMGRCLT